MPSYNKCINFGYFFPQQVASVRLCNKYLPFFGGGGHTVCHRFSYLNSSWQSCNIGCQFHLTHEETEMNHGRVLT